MGARPSSWRHQIKQHPVATVLIALLAVVIVLIVLIIFGYVFNWDWTGLNATDLTSTPQKPTSIIVYQPGKTLWDWLQLLIIPAVLAVAGYVINLTISRGEQAATEQRSQSEREAAEKRADSEREATEKRIETERKIAEDNQHETALKEYIDKMSELIRHEGLLGPEPRKEVREIARIQTLTVLNRLDGKRKGIIVQFLHDSNLISLGKTIINLYKANLSQANLSETDLSAANLVNVDLSRANLSQAYLGYVYIPQYEQDEEQDEVEYTEGADLSRANLSGANLNGANLERVQLMRANLTEAKLNSANLGEADLSGANLTNADLSGANLISTNLSGANLIGVDLSYAKLLEADLRYSNLSGADLTNSQLNRFIGLDENSYGANLSKANLTGVTGITDKELEQQAKSLKGATMPDGSIHP